MLSRLVITVLPRSKRLLISLLQSSSAVILELKKIKSDTVSPSICHEVMGELFQILKDDAVKVLHSICQQIWKTQQWPKDWKKSVFIPIPKRQCHGEENGNPFQYSCLGNAMNREPGRVQSLQLKRIGQD